MLVTLSDMFVSVCVGDCCGCVFVFVVGGCGLWLCAVDVFVVCCGCGGCVLWFCAVDGGGDEPDSWWSSTNQP